MENTYRRQLRGNHVLLPSQGSPHKIRIRPQPSCHP